MGIYDRDYVNDNRGMGAPPSGGGSNIFARAPGWSMTTWIIVVNIVVHIFAVIIIPNNRVYEFGNLNVYDTFQRLEVWRLITFQFLHDPNSIMHILFNMFGMWVFGPMVERYLGGKKYLAFYLMCGLAGGVLFTLLTLIGALPNGVHSQLIGASAGVFGVIVACAFVSPNSVIMLLFPPIPMKMRTFAYGYVAIALFSMLTGSNAGGNAAHIGGAIAGYYFIRHHHFLTDFFDVFGDSRKPKVSRGAHRHGSYQSHSASGPSTKEIDQILDKVSQKGLGALTDKEKKKLAEASKK